MDCKFDTPQLAVVPTCDHVPLHSDPGQIFVDTKFNSDRLKFISRILRSEFRRGLYARRYPQSFERA